MTTPILEGLNPAQRQAVEAIDGPVLIVAGPGSGKTRVITHRIAYLMGTVGISPRSILAVTFTNRAAREMKERLQRLVGTRTEQITVGTFHSFCAGVLRRHGQHVGLDTGFTIFDDEDQRDALKLAMEEAEVDPKRFPVRAMQSVISKAKSSLLDAQALAQRQSSFFEETAARVYARYEEMLGRYNAVDFDDLLSKAVYLFRNTPDVLHRYQQRYVHVLIDEFQDTNVSQYELARLLADGYRNICVVGDPDQSIYSWRNADIRNILSFQRDYPTAKLVALEENYRSTGTVLEAAKGLIKSNRQRLDKDLRTQKAQGPAIVVSESFTEDEEAQFVLQQIDRLSREDGVKKGDCAVMYRVNAQSRAFEEACLRYGMEYRLVGGVRFYHRREVKDLIAYLRAIGNPEDQVSLLRIINKPARGIGNRTVEQVSFWASTQGISVNAALERIAEERSAGGAASHPLSSRAAQAVSGFAALLKSLREESRRLDVVELVDTVLDRISYRAFLQAGDDAEDRWENVMELRSAAQEFKGLEPGGDLTALLERLALVADIDNYKESLDALTLITLHQSKGLEFPVVFICGMEEGLLPHFRSMDSPEELEEERRLCYVGITRCMERLFLTRAFRRGFMGGSGGPTIPSRFLQEIPSHLIESPTPLAKKREVWAARPAVVVEAVPALPLRTGDRVSHGVFGEGVVVSSTGKGSDQEVTVAFAGGAGVKRLLLSYAPLEKVES